MTILVTGGAGHIGTTLIKALAAKGEHILAADIREKGTPPKGAEHCYKYRQIDIGDGDALDALIREIKPSCIYHLGALLTENSEKNYHESFRVNVEGTMKLLESVKRHGPIPVFFGSSRGTYGLGLGDCIDDLTLQRPLSFYGWGKLYCEGIGRWYWEHFGVDFRALRFPTVIAPGIRTPGHWAPSMMEDAITGRPHRSLYGSPDDCGVFLYIEDAARAAIELMAAPADQIKMRVYNVTGMNQMVRTKDLGDYLQQRFDGFSVEYAEQKSIKPNTPLIDDRFARDEWGWRPQFNSLELIVDRFKLDFVQPN